MGTNFYLKKKLSSDLKEQVKEFLDNEVIFRLYKECNLKENVRAQELELNDFIKLYEVLRCI